MATLCVSTPEVRARDADGGGVTQGRRRRGARAPVPPAHRPRVPARLPSDRRSRAGGGFRPGRVHAGGRAAPPPSTSERLRRVSPENRGEHGHVALPPAPRGGAIPAAAVGPATGRASGPRPGNA